MGDAFRRKALHDALPPYWRSDLFDQRVDRFLRGALRLRIDVGDDRDARIACRHGPQFGRQPHFRGFHQRAMKRRAHRQRNGAPGAEGFGALARARHRGGTAGDHDLSGRIQIGRADHFAVRRLFARPGHAGFVETENRRHCPLPHRHGLLHVAATIAHQPDGILKSQRAGGDVRGIFAQAVTGDEGRLQAAPGKQPPGGNAHRQDRRLRVLGELQPLGRAVENQLAQRFAERRVGFGKGPGANLELIGERLAHAHRLRSLPWKDARNHDRPTVTDAISVRSRSVIWFAAMRDAIATALRSAFTDDRPCPTMHRPATPSSGAPPNSE
jgi:hypothetical protein